MWLQCVGLGGGERCLPHSHIFLFLHLHCMGDCITSYSRIGCICLLLEMIKRGTFFNLPNDLGPGFNLYLSVWREGFLSCGSELGSRPLRMSTLDGDIESSSWKAHEVPE